MDSTSIILKIICPDRPGLVSQLSSWVSNNGGNIIHADHHSDNRANLFLSRIEWNLDGFYISRKDISLEVEILSGKLGGSFEIGFSDERPNAAIFVSKQDHCLIDLLWRMKSAELNMRVPLIISNHPDLEKIATDFGADFQYIEIFQENKLESEKKIIKLLSLHDIQLIILAKYMQVLSDQFLSNSPPAINIHHSFLPAFKGAQPYHRAWERGVKVIGATAHYVTKDLDDGPIIEQCIVNVSHRDDVKDLIRKGRDLERMALARAVRLHLKKQVFVYQNRTAVFA